MNNKNSLYAEEKFIEAFHELTIGIGEIKERVRNAFGKLNTVRKKDLPDHLIEDFERIKKV